MGVRARETHAAGTHACRLTHTLSLSLALSLSLSHTHTTRAHNPHSYGFYSLAHSGRIAIGRVLDYREGAEAEAEVEKAEAEAEVL